MVLTSEVVLKHVFRMLLFKTAVTIVVLQYNKMISAGSIYFSRSDITFNFVNT